MADKYKLFGTYRAILALFVVFEHFLPAFAPKDWEFINSVIWGRIGVLLFFVVSGFVIADACDSFYKNRPLAFLKNRFWRIYPPYILALFLSIIIQYLLSYLQAKAILPAQPEPPYYARIPDKLVLLKNLVAPFDTDIPNGLEHYTIYVRYIWAVVVEIQFYLFMAAVVLLRIPLLMAVIAALSIYFYSMYYNLPSQLVVVGSIPYFLLGILMYVLTLRKNKTNIWLVLLTAFVAYLTINNFCMGSNKKFDVVLTTVIFSAMLVVLYILSHINSNNLLIKKIDSLLGNISYPLYLNHYIVEIAIVGLLPRSSTTFICGIVIVLAFSYAAYISVEPFTKRIRNKVRGYALN